MIIATATEIQNNFGHYLQEVQNGNDVIILKNGKEAARLISKESNINYLTDSLTGVLSKDYNDKKMIAERMTKYEGTD